MKVYIYQRFMYFFNVVEIWDEDGKTKYILERNGKVGQNFRILDTSGHETAIVKQKISLFKNVFLIIINGREIEVRFRHKMKINGEGYCEITGLDLTTGGNIDKHEYTIDNAEKTLACVKNAMFNDIECYELEYGDDVNEDEITALFVAIELAKSVEANNCP